MKLSEAIRLGAMLAPQGRRLLRDGYGTCALGAALEAAGGDCLDLGASDVLRVHFPILRLVDINCPACGISAAQLSSLMSHNGSLYGVIGHLNDDHEWTREQIADLVQTIEAQHEPAAPVETPDTVTV